MTSSLQQTTSVSAKPSSMSNKDAAIYYLSALRDDVKRSATRHYFASEYVSYRDLSIREAQLTTALNLVQNKYAAVPIDEPTDEELLALAADAA